MADIIEPVDGIHLREREVHSDHAALLDGEIDGVAYTQVAAKLSRDTPDFGVPDDNRLDASEIQALVDKYEVIYLQSVVDLLT
jgi:hypothetical protein